MAFIVAISSQLSALGLVIAADDNVPKHKRVLPLAAQMLMGGEIG